MKRNLVAGSFVLCSALLGCVQGPSYAGVEFDVQSAPPLLVSIQSDRITLVAGVAVQVSVEPLSSDDYYDDQDLVSLRGGNANMLQVFASKKDREFVLVALLAGDTCLDVTINRHSEECIPVHIVDPTD